MSTNLYDKYGGFAGVSNVVQSFYEKISDSDSLAPYFDGVDMSKLIHHQTNFLCKVLGGPDNYKGASLAAAHRSMKITTAAFDEVAQLLKESMDEAGMESADVATILGVVGSVKNDIVTA